MLPISVIILAKKHDNKLDQCIESAKNFSETIVVIDGVGKSTSIKGAKFLYRNLSGDFASQRNFALKNASNNWVLFIDSDEVLSQKLRLEIQNISDTNINGYFIRREDKFLGHNMKYGDTGNFWITRLANRNKGEWTGKVHEEWKVSGRTSYLKTPIIHYSHDSISNFIRKLDFYSSIRAKEINSWGGSSSIFHIVFFPVLKFCYLYFIKLGFLDGVHGFVHAVFMSMYTFLVRGKLYQLNRDDK